jgi:hypothetical protein
MNRSALALGGIFAFVGAVTIAQGHSMNRLGVGTPTRTSGPISTRTQLLTAVDCQLYSINGKVEICHATGSGYNQLVVSVEACVNGHGGHEPDIPASINGCPEQ